MAEYADGDAGDGTRAFAVRTEDTGGGVLVLVSGEYDLASAETVTAALLAAEGRSRGRVLLDLSEVTFLDSTGLGTLIAGAARSSDDGQRLRIVPSSVVRHVIGLAGVGDRLPLIDDT